MGLTSDGNDLLGDDLSQRSCMQKAVSYPPPHSRFCRTGGATGETSPACATEPGKFYDAKDPEEIKQAFRDIALKLSSLFRNRPRVGTEPPAS